MEKIEGKSLRSEVKSYLSHRKLSIQLDRVKTGTVVLKFKKKGILFVQECALFLARDQSEALQMCFTSEMLHVVTS